MNILRFRCVQKFLSLSAVWRLTGLTYYTAALATQGRFLDCDELIELGREEMSFLLPYLTEGCKVLEFGSGLGKNLFGVSGVIGSGVGLDVNRLYVREANRIRLSKGIGNVSFVWYNGSDFPSLPRFDVIFEKGVFERLSAGLVNKYIETLASRFLNEHGIMALYFLSERARGSSFTRWLGDNSYIFWTPESVREMLDGFALRTLQVVRWEFADVFILQRRE